jgi:DNA-binding NtrC family response regulator
VTNFVDNRVPACEEARLLFTGAALSTAKHIVIVDDDEAYRYALEREFAAAGWTTRVFADWTGVLEVFEAGEPADVLLADLRLPSGTPNGLSLARMAAKRRGTLKIAFITAYPDLEHAVPPEFGPVFSKGEDLSQLVAAVAAL